MNQKTELKLNISVVLFSQILMLVANFFTKQAILLSLNAEYMGLQTVCANFCDLFTMAFSAAGMVMLYRLYKPLEAHDQKKISAIFFHFKSVFKNLALGTVLAGAVLSVVTLLCVNTSFTTGRVMFYYWLYLTGILAYNGFLYNYYLLMADQKRYVSAGICGIVDIVALGIEIAFIVYTKNYGLFLIIIVLKNLFENLLIFVYRKKTYGFIKPDKDELIDDDEKRSITKNIYDMIISKIGTLLLYNTDSILISAIVSTTISGFYSCYYFIVYGLQFTMVNVFDTIIPKIGQLGVRGGKQSQFRNYILVSILNIFTTTLCVTGFYLVCEDFIILWVGEGALLDHRLIVIIAINLYISMTRYTSSSFRQAEGLFNKISWLILFRGVFNVLLSIVMGIRFGLLGIVAATSISDGLTVFWYEPYMMLKFYRKKLYLGIIYEALAIFSCLSAIFIAGSIISGLPQGSWLYFILKVFIIAAVALIWLGIIAGVIYLIYRSNRKSLGRIIDASSDSNNGPTFDEPEAAKRPLKFSFILPVYNGERFVRSSVESVLDERQRDLEVIAIDDGSTDGTLNILNEIAASDSRLKVIHTQNRGQGLARNLGIKMASGDYLCFIDADDMVLWHGMGKLMDLVCQRQWDIVCGNYIRRYKHHKAYGLENAESGPVYHNDNELYNLIKTKSVFGYCWNKLFKAEFVRANLLEFEDVRRVYMEDTLFCLKAFAKNPSYYFLNEPVYMYTIEDGSFSRRDIPDMDNKCINLLTIYGNHLRGQNSYAENLDLLVPLYMRVFCWVLLNKVHPGETKMRDVTDSIELFVNCGNFREVISDTDNIRELDKLESLPERLLFKSGFRILNRGKFRLLAAAFVTFHNMFRLYINVFKIK